MSEHAEWTPPAGIKLVQNPIFIMMNTPDGLVAHVHPPTDWNHKAYGLAICDLVRHCALALRCDEDDI